MFRKKVLLSTVVVLAFLGGREFVEAQPNADKPKVVNEKLEEKFANVSPKPGCWFIDANYNSTLTDLIRSYPI